MKKWLGIFLILCGCVSLQEENVSLVAIHIQDRNGLNETISQPEKLEFYEETDFLSPQPYKKVMRVFKKGGKNHSLITTYHPNGTPWQYLEAEEMRAHGIFQEWHPNGVLKIQATVIGGTADVALGSQHDWLFDGISRIWNEQGVLMAEFPYSRGALQGKSSHYYETGALKKTLPYLNHKLEGLGIEYYPSGQLKAEIRFKGDVQHGPSVGLFEEGKLCWEEEWIEGKLQHGHFFDKEEQMVAKVHLGNGMRAVFQEGILIQLMEVREGKMEGIVKNLNPQGQLVSTYLMIEGKKQGPETLYYPKKGSPKLQIQWDQDAIHGRVQTWYENGQLQSEKEYCRNKKMGQSLAWYPDGSVMLVEEYEHDLLLKGKYYKKGIKDSVSSVQNGTGVAHLYDESGTLIHKIPYVKGKAVDPEP